MTADFDHTSIAVRDAQSWLGWLRSELGATPICGEVLPAFRYVLSHVGDVERGARLELMDAEPGDGSGFLQRFLDKHGEGVHHMTFTVPDIEAAMDQVRSLGFDLVGTDLSHLPWQETFLFPDPRFGVVIQLAQSNSGYPPLAELLGSQERDAAAFPNNREGRDFDWWHAAWEAPAGPTVALRRTVLRTTDPAMGHRLFGDVLGGIDRTVGPDTEYRWPSGGRLLVRPAERAGVERLVVDGGPASTFHIGSATFTVEENT